MSDFSDELWRSYWHLAGHLSELQDPRDFVRLTVGRNEVVLFNDGKDIIAFDNRCPHRGARIFDGQAGNSPFLCRYHGWSYANGKLFVADKQQFQHCDLSNATLSNLHLERLGDFFFVSVSPRMSLEQQLGGLMETVRQISQTISMRHDFNSYSYDCFWPIAVENALESYHVAAIHPKSLNQLLLNDGLVERHGLNSIWYTQVGNARVANRLNRLAKMFDLAFAHPGYMNMFLFPFSMISSTFGLSYSIQNFLPGQTDASCSFFSRLFTSKVKSGTNEKIFHDFFDSTAKLNRQVFHEDNTICSRLPQDAWSFEPPQIYARSEERIVYFREACSAASAAPL
jgi:phenylpropionate dioxygenase-like ring-hydroxylating dioxygenase large terminal subunit